MRASGTEDDGKGGRPAEIMKISEEIPGYSIDNSTFMCYITAVLTAEDSRRRKA